MSLAIRRFVGGPLQTNAYLVSNASTGDAVLIDAPPDVCNDVTAAVDAIGAEVDRIILTHGHWDHVLGLAELKRALDARALGFPGLQQRLEAGIAGPMPMPPARLDATLDDGDEVDVGGHVFTVLHMPGHDPDSIMLFNRESGIIIGGDVLFPNGHGRTDIPGSDQAAMNRSLRRLLDLPDDVRVLPGHGEETTIGRERPWITQISNTHA